jgi:hypothetical protein
VNHSKSQSNIQPITSTVDPLKTGLPANIFAERLVLGSILLDGTRFAQVADIVRPDDFSVERHRRILQRMFEVGERGEKIDHVTVANEMLRWNELESDGLSYLISLESGLPQLPNLDSYIRIIREKAILRSIVYVARDALNHALVAEEHPGEILARFSEQIETLRTDITIQSANAIDDLPGVGVDIEEVRYLHEPELPEGSVVALTGDSGSGKSTLSTAWARNVTATGRRVLILDRENPRSVVKERMERLGMVDSDALRWAGGWNGDVPEPDSPAVIEWVQACDPKPLIIVDCLIAFFKGDENSAADMRRFMDKLRRLSFEGATVVVIHHDGKADKARDYRGSSDMKASIDQSFHVTNVGPSMRLDTLRLRCFKSRYGLSGDIVYRYADGRFVRDERPTAPARTVADQLRALLQRNPGIGVREFEKKAADEGIARSAARDFVESGVQEGSVGRTPAGRNKFRLTWEGCEFE